MSAPMLDLMTDRGNGNYGTLVVDPRRITSIEVGVRSQSAFNYATGCVVSLDDGRRVFTYTSEMVIRRAVGWLP